MSRMVSCSVAQAMHLVKATRVHVMSARHVIKKARRTWALQVGIMLLSPLNSRVHRPFNTLRRQLPWGVSYPATSRTTIFRTGASGALVSLPPPPRLFTYHP